MANVYFTNGKVGQLDGSFQWGTTAFKVMLLSNYTPNVSQSVYTNISASETTGTGYTAGGAALGTQSVSSQSNSHASVDAPDTSWSGSSITAAWAVIWATATSKLVGAYDFGGPQTTSSGTFTISWHSSDGILTLA